MQWDAVEGGTLNCFWSHHGVNRVTTGAEIVNESELKRTFTLRYGEYGHRIHSREKLGPERWRPTARLNLLVALFAEELARTFILVGSSGFVPGQGVVIGLFIGKKPEAFSQSSDDGIDEGTVRMVKKEFLKTVDIDGGYNFE